VDWYKFTIVPEVCTASTIRVMSLITLMMEAVQTSEMLVILYKPAQRYN
jgi:siroheme synthase